MDMSRKPLIVGNWKMHGLRRSLAEISASAKGVAEVPGVDVAICPPATLLALAAALPLGSLRLGGQDCSAMAGEGAHTGDLCADMLADLGAVFCIVGHSERRADHGESSALVRKKAEAVQQAGLVPVICVGETLAERDAGRAEAVVTDQLAVSIPNSATGDLIIAYEPVWAIGTGRVPAQSDIAAMHTAIRGHLERRFGAAASSMRVLYGGSVKPSNAGEVFGASGVDGALVGGASLKSADFLAIIRAHPASASR